VRRARARARARARGRAAPTPRRVPSAAMSPTVLAAQKLFQGRTGHALVHMKKGCV
jgi:hypothetical protein